MTREVLEQRIMRILGVRDPERAMDKLQLEGLVSDNAVYLTDVPDGDLIDAYGHLAFQNK